MPAKRLFVLLIGNKERGDVNHFQLLQEDTAHAEGKRLGLSVEVAFAPGFDQLRVLKKRTSDAASPVDAVSRTPLSKVARKKCGSFGAKKNVRVLKVGEDLGSDGLEYRQISGGYLVQDQDLLRVSADDLRVVTERQPTEKEMEAMLFGWTVCKHVKSNAIVLASDIQTVGVGAGQMNRVDSVRIAAMRAERTDLQIEGSALASDAFFPFRDNVDEAAKIGISAIIQPGGSMRDDESIEAANEHGITMVFTGYRHFKH